MKAVSLIFSNLPNPLALLEKLMQEKIGKHWKTKDLERTWDTSGGVAMQTMAGHLLFGTLRRVMTASLILRKT